MRTLPSITTPLLRLAVKKLTGSGKFSKAIITADKYILGNKIAETIVKTDDYLQSKESLRYIFSSDLEADLRTIRPFLKEDLISVVVGECLHRERLAAQLPKPGATWPRAPGDQETPEKVAAECQAKPSPP